MLSNTKKTIARFFNGPHKILEIFNPTRPKNGVFAASLQIFAKICKDAENVRFCLKERLQRWHRPHWRYKYYIPPVWTGPSLQHSWTFSIRSAIFVPSLRRLCCSLCRSLLQRPRRTPPKKFENTPHFL